MRNKFLTEESSSAINTKYFAEFVSVSNSWTLRKVMMFILKMKIDIHVLLYCVFVTFTYSLVNLYHAFV